MSLSFIRNARASPHWDFDLPSTIYDLPFLKEQSKRNILGANAARLFELDSKPVKKIP